LRHGTINMGLCKDPSLPGREAILKLFGGYVQAYAAAGLPPLRSANGALGIRTMRAFVERMMTEVYDKVNRAGGTVRNTAVWNILYLNDTLTLKVSIASCRQYWDSGRRWRIALRSGVRADFVLCALMDAENLRIRCYILLSTADAEKASLYLSERTIGRYTEHCFTSLDQIFGLVDSRSSLSLPSALEE
jgi:hypothetical protein